MRASSNGDALFERSTSNDNEIAHFRLVEHRYAYAEYYFLEVGNRLIDVRQAKEHNGEA